jgi:hypothetical protein
MSDVALPPLRPEEKARMARRFFEKLDATLLQRGEPKGATAFAVSPLARAQGEPPAGDYGATVRSPTFDERAAAAPPSEPLVASPQAKPDSSPVDARQAGPPRDRPPEELSITMEFSVPADLLAQLGRLPFKPPTPGNEFARTMPVPVHNPRKGETAPLGDDSIAKAVAALPFVGARIGAGVVSFPRLSIHQYASLRAELALWPEGSGEILRRYHVMNEAAHRALLEHWQAELAASLEARATFEKDRASYTAWLRAQRA